MTRVVSRLGGTTRVTVRLPSEVLEDADRLLAKGLRPSALVRKLMEDALRAEREREDVERYVRSYTETPQTEDEFGWIDAVAIEAFSEIPWEKPPLL